MGTKVSGPGIDTTTVRVLTSGTYRRSEISQLSLSFSSGTELEVTQVATDLVADDSKDTVFTWLRIHFMLFDSAEVMPFEYALIRCDTGDALQDMNSDSTMEELQQEGRILARGIKFVGDVNAGGPCPLIKIEKYKVVVPDGEELRLVVKPMSAGTASGGVIRGVLEWREAGN